MAKGRKWCGFCGNAFNACDLQEYSKKLYGESRGFGALLLCWEEFGRLNLGGM